MLDNAINTWVTDQNDKGILNCDNKLDEDTLMWEATLDLDNESSAIRKVLAGSLSGEEAIESCISDLDSVYEEGVKAYATRAKTYINQLYTSLHNSVTDMKVAVALENAYVNVLKVYGYDGSSATTSYMGSYAKAYDLKSYDSVDNYYSAARALLAAVASNCTTFKCNYHF